MGPVIVLDASVLLKWALKGPEESDSSKALVLLENWAAGMFEIALPKLWAYEVGNVLGMKHPSRADELMEIFIGYSFVEVGISPEICRTTYSLVRKCRVSFYDAVYHAVALRSQGILITADEAYHRNAAGFGCIRLLRDFRLPV